MLLVQKQLRVQRWSMALIYLPFAREILGSFLNLGCSYCLTSFIPAERCTGKLNWLMLQDFPLEIDYTICYS
ncbi:hypothetical protein F4801DRAFT_560917 [Xylaria longipes]|nr:hypothetical protein F4801DRAFT_560917 [Xylaria longipes]